MKKIVPDTKEPVPVAHLRIKFNDMGPDGLWFGVYGDRGYNGDLKKAFASGPVNSNLPAQLRRAATVAEMIINNHLGRQDDKK